MPLVSGPSPSGVYYTTEGILNKARVLVNDAQGSLAGQILADSEPYTWELLNICYDDLANTLEDTNVESAMYAEATVSLPISLPTGDPEAVAMLGPDGFIDASGNLYPQPILPPDLVEPLTLWQRQTGSNQPYMEMIQRLGGLAGGYVFSATIGNTYYGQWDFFNRSIRMRGAAGLTDIMIRYIPSLPELLEPTPQNPESPRVYFARAGLALAYMVAAEFQELRGAANAPMLRLKANRQLQIIANKTAKRENQTQTRRRGYGFNRRRRFVI